MGLTLAWATRAGTRTSMDSMAAPADDPAVGGSGPEQPADLVLPDLHLVRPDDHGGFDVGDLEGDLVVDILHTALDLDDRGDVAAQDVLGADLPAGGLLGGGVGHDALELVLLV